MSARQANGRGQALRRIESLDMVEYRMAYLVPIRRRSAGCEGAVSVDGLLIAYAARRVSLLEMLK